MLKKVKSFAKAKNKTDKRDAKLLAWLLLKQELPTAYLPTKKEREAKELTRHRTILIKQRTMIKNQVHALLSRKGIKTLQSDIFTKNMIQWSQQLSLEPNSKTILESQLDTLKFLNQQTKSTDNIIKQQANQNSQAKKLLNIKGIAELSALTIVNETGNIKRFQTPKQFCSWIGIVPSTHQSGNTTRHGPITKQGNSKLRWILTQCSHSAVIQPGYLQQHFKHLRKKKPYNIAITACARKLATHIWYKLNS